MKITIETPTESVTIETVQKPSWLPAQDVPYDPPIVRHENCRCTDGLDFSPAARKINEALEDAAIKGVPLFTDPSKPKPRKKPIKFKTAYELRGRKKATKRVRR